jgi:hypothetical protein
MKALSELAKQGMVRIRRDALDDELPSRDADREGRAFTEQHPQFALDAADGGLQQRMPCRIDRRLVHGD